MRLSAKRLARLAMLAAVLCLVAPLKLDIGAVPITLQTLVVALAGALLGPVDGAIAVGVYLLLGLAGLPVFAGWMSGFAYFVGPTGGFLVGFLALAALTGLRRWWAGLFGLAAVYLLGTAWLMKVTGLALGAALWAGVWPFVLKDAASVALAYALGRILQRRLSL